MSDRGILLIRRGQSSLKVACASQDADPMPFDAPPTGHGHAQAAAPA